MKFIILGSIVVLFILLIKTRIRPALLFFSVLCFFYFLNLIELEKLLVNFVNPAIMILIVLFILADVLERTYLLDYLSHLFFTKGSRKKTVLKFTGITAVLSAFMNNTAIVVSFLGIVKNNKSIAPSKLLIPLSYAAIVGGASTLIGTSTNLIINSFVIDAGLTPLKMTDFVYVGVPIAACGILYLTFFSQRLLPELQQQREEKPQNFFIEAKVLKGSSLIGKNLSENRLRKLDAVYLAEIVRNNVLISPVTPDEIIQEDDMLVFTGEITNIKDIERFDKLRIFGETEEILRGNLTEVVVSHESDLIGRKIREVNFRSKFDAAVVAVRHGRKRMSGKIGLIELLPGDVLVLAAGPDFYKRDNVYHHFYMVNELSVNSRISGYKGIACVALFLGAIILSAVGLVDLFKSLLAVLFIFLLFKFTTIEDIKKSVHYDLVLLIGSAIGISEVMISTGASGFIAGYINGIFSPLGVYGSFIGIYLLTVVITEVVTNNAAAALAFPLGYSTAVSLGVDPMPFIMAVAYGASCSFLTPFGYQTNTLVYSAGGYRFSDYTRAGFAMSAIYSINVIFLVPYFFKF